MSEAVAVFRASRPNFLILAPLCAGLGVAVAWRQGLTTPWLDTLLVLLGAVLAHAAVNLFNEYDDFVSGLDLTTRRTPFSGGSGALPERPSAARSVRVAALLTLGLVIAIGLYFLLGSGGLPLLLLGATGVVLVVTYTRWITRRPLLCLIAPGLGFGPVMVLGAALALGAQPDRTAVVVSIVAWLLVSELLLINQIPDAEADANAGRHHLVISVGRHQASRLVGLLWLASYLVILTGLATASLPPWAALALLTVPASLWLSRTLPTAIDQPALLNRVLGVNVASLLATLALLLASLSF